MSSVAAGAFDPATVVRYVTFSAVANVLMVVGDLLSDALREIDGEVAKEAHLEGRISGAFPELDKLLAELVPRELDPEDVPEFSAVEQHETLETAKLLLVLASNADGFVNEAHRFIGLAQARQEASCV